MAGSLLQPPNTFSFDKPEEWSRWKGRFQQYRIASGLSTKSGKRQVSTLLYCMGEASEDILNMSGISDEDKKVFDRVITRYDAIKEEMIRDRLVVGIQDQSLSERLQMEPDLTLEKAKKLVRQRETVKQQAAHLKGTASEVKTHYTPKNKRFTKPNTGQNKAQTCQ